MRLISSERWPSDSTCSAAVLTVVDSDSIVRLAFSVIVAPLAAVCPAWSAVARVVCAWLTTSPIDTVTSSMAAAAEDVASLCAKAERCTLVTPALTSSVA